VRTEAQQVLDKLDQSRFDPLRRFTYTTEAVYESFDQWCDRVVGIDPDRAAALERHREDLNERFHRLGERRPNGWAFIHNSLVTVTTAR